jgi:hypothetical protein
MKFVGACLVWLLMAAVLGVGLWKVAYGASIWFLLIPVFAFVVAVGAIGCRTH